MIIQYIFKTRGVVKRITGIFEYEVRGEIAGEISGVCSVNEYFHGFGEGGTDAYLQNEWNEYSNVFKLNFNSADYNVMIFFDTYWKYILFTFFKDTQVY